MTAFAITVGAAVFLWAAPARAEKMLAFAKLIDPSEFTLAKDILRPHIKPDDYNPALKPDEDRASWPDTYEKYVRRFVRVVRVDINDDGVDELFYSIQDTGYCGSSGCWSLIFQRQDGRWKLICSTSFGANVVITDWVSEGGYRELRNRHTMYWRNGQCYSNDPEVLSKHSPENYPRPPAERIWKPIQ